MSWYRLAKWAEVRHVTYKLDVTDVECQQWADSAASGGRAGGRSRADDLAWQARPH